MQPLPLFVIGQNSPSVNMLTDLKTSDNKNFDFVAYSSAQSLYSNHQCLNILNRLPPPPPPPPHQSPFCMYRKMPPKKKDPIGAVQTTLSKFFAPTSSSKTSSKKNCAVNNTDEKDDFEVCNIEMTFFSDFI